MSIRLDTTHVSIILMSSYIFNKPYPIDYTNNHYNYYHISISPFTGELIYNY